MRQAVVTILGGSVLRRRPLRRGPESRLVTRALRALAGSSGPSAVILREPELPTGAPDLVLLFPRSTSLSAKRSMLTREHFRLLHALHALGPTPTRSLARSLNREMDPVRRLLGALAEARLVTVEAQRAYPLSIRRTFGLRRIVAVEAKMTDWRTGLEQAVANTWFASESYLLVPDRSIAERAMRAAAAFGVGVLHLDRDRLRVTQQSAKLAIPLSDGSWILSEWVVRLRDQECSPKSRRLFPNSRNSLSFPSRAARKRSTPPH